MAKSGSDVTRRICDWGRPIWNMLFVTKGGETRSVENPPVAHEESVMSEVGQQGRNNGGDDCMSLSMKLKPFVV